MRLLVSNKIKKLSDLKSYFLANGLDRIDEVSQTGIAQLDNYICSIDDFEEKVKESEPEVSEEESGDSDGSEDESSDEKKF